MVAVPSDRKKMGAIEGKGAEEVLLLPNLRNRDQKQFEEFFIFLDLFFLSLAAGQTELWLGVVVGLPPHNRQCGRLRREKVGEAIPFPWSLPCTVETWLMPGHPGQLSARPALLEVTAGEKQQSSVAEAGLDNYTYPRKRILRNGNICYSLKSMPDRDF